MDEALVFGIRGRRIIAIAAYDDELSDPVV